jgi:predicted aspartyl protease
MLRRSVLLAGLVAFAATSTVALAQAANCKLQKVVEWKVRSIGRHMAVDGAINGKKIGLVLDTGASLSILFRSAAKRLDLPLTESRGSRIYGVGGQSQVYTAVIEEFKLGEAPVRDFTVTVAGDENVGEGFDLLLGEDFLSHFDIEFDLAHDSVRLWQPKDCGERPLAYWTKEVVGEVAIEPTSETNRKIMFTVHLNGTPVHTMLDSGASTTVVSKHDAERLGVKATPIAASTSGVGPKSIELSVGKFASFAIGNEEIPDVEILVADIFKNATYQGTGSRVARNVFDTQPMLLGADFLRSHRTYVSHAQKKMYFTYTGGPVFVTGRKPPPVPADEPAKKN